MNLQWLIYFQTIAELENYTQATKKLHVSQSNLSHAMRSLEEKLGVELFEKDGRNIRLSKYGEIFLPYVNKTLDSLDEGIAKLKEFLDPIQDPSNLLVFLPWLSFQRTLWFAISQKQIAMMCIFSMHRLAGTKSMNLSYLGN